MTDIGDPDEDEIGCCECDCQGDGGISGGCLCSPCVRGCGGCTCCCDCPESYGCPSECDCSLCMTSESRDDSENDNPGGGGWHG